MLGGRALFAFQRGEITSDGGPSPDAVLGALMWSEFQAAMLSWMDGFGKFVDAWAKSKRRR